MDSKSVLYSLESLNMSVRGEMLYEICHLVHTLILRGSSITFCWVPSHCGLLFNEWADRAAKAGARSKGLSEKLNIPLSLHEAYRNLKRIIWLQLEQKNQTFTIPANISWCRNIIINLYRGNVKNRRSIAAVISRLKLNALKTKYSKNVKCTCGDMLSPQHIIFDCSNIRNVIPPIDKKSMKEFFSDHSLVLTVAKSLLSSSIYSLL